MWFSLQMDRWFSGHCIFHRKILFDNRAERKNARLFYNNLMYLCINGRKRNDQLIDWVRPGKTGKYMALGHDAYFKCSKSVCQELKPIIFSCVPPTQCINSLHPNISMHILHTVLYTNCKVLTRRICSTIMNLLIVFDRFLYSCDLNVWLRAGLIRRI